MTGRKQVFARFTAIILALVTVLFIVTVPSYAESKIRLSKTKLTLKTGKSYTLKITGTKKKAKWSVYGKKLVTIKTRGTKRHKAVVKAGKKAGTCYVKVKVGKKVRTCKLTVKKPQQTKPEEFKEKELSGTAKDLTASFTANAVTGKETDETFRKAMTETSLAMLKYLASHEKDPERNVLISPDSILTAMTMVENGAAGNTLTEMENAFGMISLDDYNAYLYQLNKRVTSSKSVKYHMADSIWYRENEINVKDEFLQKNVDYFNSQIFEAPFSTDTVSDINNWVYNNTKGMIPSIIDDLGEDTVMLLLNAIAFEGEWAEKYEDYQIKNLPFTDINGAVKKVAMLEGTESIYVKVGGADGFIKNYKGGKIAFLGLKTPEGMTVDQFLQGLSAEDFVQGYNNRNSKDYIVSTKMPEFKYDYDTSLVDTLKSLGIKDAFDNNASDLSGIAALNPYETLSISDVLHKTHIELDRNGTKAAAVTAVIVDKASAAPDEKERVSVVLDHPFVYAIIDTESGIPLFIGTVKDL